VAAVIVSTIVISSGFIWAMTGCMAASTCASAAARWAATACWAAALSGGPAAS
jgi:hypothetical protein